MASDSYSLPKFCHIFDSGQEKTILNVRESNYKIEGFIVDTTVETDYGPFIKTYVQPIDTSSNKTEIIDIIGENSFPLWNINTNFGTVIIGKDKNGKTIDLQTLSWSSRGKKYYQPDEEQYIKIIICQAFENHVDYINEVRDILINLISKLYSVFPGLKSNLEDNEVTFGEKNITLGSKLILSPNFVNYLDNNYLNNGSPFNYEDFINEIQNKIADTGIEYTDIEPIIGQESDPIIKIENKRVFRLKRKTLKIEKNKKQDILKEKIISFPQLIPLIQKTSMELTGTGINFYQQLMYLKETFEYLYDNSIEPEWNLLSNQLLSSLNFNDINLLKQNLMLQNNNQNYSGINEENITTNEGNSSNKYNKNYLVYPTKVMWIYRFDHDTKHNDFPWDEDADPNESRSYCYCPCDEMYVARISYRDKSSAGSPNVVWLTSTDKVVFANGEENIVSLMIMHGEDADIEKLSQGQIFKRGDPIILEGQTGYATGYHFHFSVGTGEIIDGGWQPGWGPPNGSLTVSGKCLRAQDAFFVDPNFTDIQRSLGVDFKELKE